VQGNANRLSRLVDDLLDLSRIEAGRLELRPTNIDVASIGQDVVASLQTLAADKKIALAIDTNGEATAWADADRVHQILVNLVGNAVKFTPDGGRVDVRVGGDTDEISAAVSDTGPYRRGTTADDLRQVPPGRPRCRSPGRRSRVGHLPATGRVARRVIASGQRSRRGQHLHLHPPVHANGK
jgi:signal transduction histidine kinase